MKSTAIETTHRPDSSVELIDVYTNDRAAVEAWLQQKPNASPHSIRAYRQAVAHLWSWLASRRGTQAPDALLTMRTLEAQAYLADMLRATSGQPSNKKPLSAKTVHHRITVLASMYAFWMRPRDGGRAIVAFNPFDGMASKIAITGKSNMGADRSLSPEEQAVVEAVLEQLPRGTLHQEKHYRRARLIWMLSSRMALRRFEIASLKVNDFRRTASGKHWKIEIHGKGRKENQDADTIIVPDVVMDEVKEYLKAFGQHPEPLPSNSSPLVQHINAGHRYPHVSDTHVARVMKEVFRMAGKYAEKELRSPHLTKRLEQASLHWGRHTWFMNSLKEHDLRFVSAAGRHRDIRTTMKNYVGTSEDELARVMASGKPLAQTPP